MQINTLAKLLMFLAVLVLWSTQAPSLVHADSQLKALDGLPDYVPIDIGAASINSVGSDAMEGLVEIWVAEYQRYQPKVAITVLSQGSATAASALLEGTADIGPMARPMKEAEVDEFKSKYGFEPTQVRTALAAVSIYVSKANPIDSISFAQLDAIYSSSRNRGASTPLSSWADLGTKTAFSTQPIMVLGLVDSAYPYSFFRQQVLLQGEFSPSVTATADEAALFATIKENQSAIGYGRVLPDSHDTKKLAVARNNGERGALPTLENLEQGKYPLGRYLSVYFAQDPNVGLEPATKDFLRFILSKKGQKIVLDQGLIPLPHSVVKAELLKLQ